MNSDPRKKRSPLRGIRVLVGRARHQASALSSGLRALGARVIEIPFIEIRKPRSYAPLDTALRHLDQYDWLILTSVNGVEALWGRAGKLRIPKKSFSHLRLAAIGPATRKAISVRGLKVHVVPKEYVAESVVDSLRGQVNGQRVLLARAKVARDVIPRELRKLGAEVDVVEAYETVLPRASGAKLRNLLKKNWVALLGGQLGHGARASRVSGSRLLLDGVCLASIGPVTSSTLREIGLRADIEAGQYTIPGLIDAIADYQIATVAKRSGL